MLRPGATLLPPSPGAWISDVGVHAGSPPALGPGHVAGALALIALPAWTQDDGFAKTEFEELLRHLSDVLLGICSHRP